MVNPICVFCKAPWVNTTEPVSQNYIAQAAWWIDKHEQAQNVHSSWCDGTCGKGGFSSNSMEYCQAQQELILAAQPPCNCVQSDDCVRHAWRQNNDR